MTFLDTIVKHNYGIIGTLAVHMLLFVWFNIENMSFTIIDPHEKVVAVLDFTEAEAEIPNKEINSEAQGTELSNVVTNQDQKETSFTNEDHYFDQQQANKEVLEELKELESNVFKSYSADNPTLNKTETPNNSINPNLIKEDAKENENASFGSNILATATYSLSNRKFLYQKIPSYKCKEQGVVRINIKVNQKGNVVNNEINESKTNTSNDCLRQIALNYSKMWRFNQNFDDDDRKRGWIEFKFLAQ